MEKKIVKDDLKIEKACQSDWESVLQILKETGLKTYFSGNEHYNTFYIVKELETKQIICCFSIDYEDTVGILKSFAIEKNLHGKGLGKKVVNKIPEIAKRIGLKKLYATSWEAPDFWRKTDLKEITRYFSLY